MTEIKQRCNTWGLRFTQVDVRNNEIKTLLALNTGGEEGTRILFEDIKKQFPKNQGEPDSVIDLLDEMDDIIDDHPVTREQLTQVALGLGHKI